MIAINVLFTFAGPEHLDRRPYRRAYRRRALRARADVRPAATPPIAGSGSGFAGVLAVGLLSPSVVAYRRVRGLRPLAKALDPSTRGRAWALQVRSFPRSPVEAGRRRPS